MAILNEISDLLHRIQKGIQKLQPKSTTDTSEEARAFEYLLLMAQQYKDLVGNANLVHPEVALARFTELLGIITEDEKCYKHASPMSRFLTRNSRHAKLQDLRNQLDNGISDFIYASTWQLYANTNKIKTPDTPPKCTDSFLSKENSICEEDRQRDGRRLQVARWLFSLNYPECPTTSCSEDQGTQPMTKVTRGGWFGRLLSSPMT